VVVASKPVQLIDISPNDPREFNYNVFEGQGLDTVKVRHLPPVIVKDKLYVVGDGYLSYCYRFITLILFMPPLNGVKRDMDMEIKFDFCKGAPSHGARPKIIVYMDLTAWKFFMLKKDLHSKSLRWFLLL